MSETPRSTLAFQHGRDFETNDVGTAQRVKDLEAALRPFADFAASSHWLPDDHPITAGSSFSRRQLTIADCRKARDLLDGPR